MNRISKFFSNSKKRWVNRNKCPECEEEDWINDHSTGNYCHEKTCRYCRYVSKYEVTPY